MTDKLKPLLKRIDDLCTPIFKLGGDKGVKVKDLGNHLNKGPLAELAFNLFSCLYDTKRQLEDQNQHIAKATNALKDQELKINELDTSLEKGISDQTVLSNILKEVKGNGQLIAEMKASFEEKSERIATEANKVSSYAEILQKSADNKKKESHINLQPEKFAKRMISEMKASDRKKNVVFYGVPAHVNKETLELEYNDEVDGIISELGFSGLQPSYIELLKKPLFVFSADAGTKIRCTLRIQFPCEGIALKVLKCAPYLKPSLTYSRVFIAPDRTLDEQRARAKLVEKLKIKIAQQPTIKWTIRRGEIVNCGDWTECSTADQED